MKPFLCCFCMYVFIPLMCFSEESWEDEYKKWFEIGKKNSNNASLLHSNTTVNHAGFWDAEVTSRSLFDILTFVTLLNEIDHTEIPFYVNNSTIRLYSTQKINVEVLFANPKTGEFTKNVVITKEKGYDGWKVEGIHMGNIKFRNDNNGGIYFWPISLSDSFISPSFGGYVSGFYSQRNHNDRTTIGPDPFHSKNNKNVDPENETNDPFLP